ncbi:CHASE2 domain-containing protein [Arenibaculum pallidiluteum]|uniref:CHASE2 domain-containing protein n=1 Tax=Arenibaculum pallidiluteum TaxID=2812559 RepID=UPI001A96163D|nr:CHASE2 domain-containing protein [Arenibaculum pallidiluteum]
MIALVRRGGSCAAGAAAAALELFLAALPTIAITVLIAIINPFGVKDAAEDASLDVYERLMAPWYPRAGQEQIAVILMDDTSLRALGQRFPPDFTTYARIGDALTAIGAEAVFFDFNFIDRRGDDADIAFFAASLGNLPTFLAATEPASTAETCQEVNVVNLPDIAKAVRSEPHPLIRNDGRRVELWRQEPCARQADRLPGADQADWPSGLRPAAALELYRWYCWKTDGCRGSADDPRGNPDAFLGMTLTIEWGSAWPRGAESVHPAYAKLPSVCPDDSPASIVQQFRRSVLMAEKKAGDILFARGCSYHPVIRAEWLLEPDATGADADAIGRLLAGRVVLVGAIFAGQNDVAGTPVFGDMPGVMLHAMAFDNLIVRGAGFLGTWPDGWFGGLGSDDAIELAIVGVMAALGHCLAKLVSRWRPLTGLAVACVVAAAGGLLGFGCVVFLTAWQRFEPVNWVGLMLAGIVLSHPLLDAITENWRRRVEGLRSQLRLRKE